MTIKPNMDSNIAYSHNVISAFNSSPPSTMQNNNGRINHHLTNPQMICTNTNNEMITYHNHKMNLSPNPMMNGESKHVQDVNGTDEDAISLSIEDMNELDKDLAEIMNDLHIPYEMKQERSQTEYSSNNSQTGPAGSSHYNTNTNNTNTNTNTNNNSPNTKKMRKKKRKKSKHKLEKEGVSYDPPKHIRAQGNVQISKNLTENIIPSRIAEPISDIYRYMDKLTALHCIYNDMTLEINNNQNENENIMILNYGFHDKETNKVLYCIAEKQDISNNKSRGYKWRIMNRLFTDDEIQNEYNIKCDLLPKTFNQSFHFKSLLNYQLNVENLLKSDSVRTNMINNCPWHKIEIYHRTNNKRRLTLSLTKPEFMKSMQNCTRSKLAENRNICGGSISRTCGDNINLIPILLFDNDQCQYLIEFVWILEIEPEIDIGISFKYIANNDSLKVTGIHLDAHFIKNQHQLIDPHHDCHCLDSFKTKVNMMAIGNPDDNINKIKYYKQQIDELQLYKENLVELLTTSDNNRRDQVIQALIQKTGIGHNNNSNKQQCQRMNVMNQQQQQYNRNNMPSQPMGSPSNMSMNMNMNMNMNRYNVNHCQVQPRPQSQMSMMSRMQQQQQQQQSVIAGNQNRNAIANNNNHVNYHNMNMNMNMNNVNVNANNVSSNSQYRSNNNQLASNINCNRNNNTSTNQNLFNPIYNGMGTNNAWHGSPVQMSTMYPIVQQ